MELFSALSLRTIESVDSRRQLKAKKFSRDSLVMKRLRVRDSIEILLARPLLTNRFIVLSLVYGLSYVFLISKLEIDLNLMLKYKHNLRPIISSYVTLIIFFCDRLFILLQNIIFD